MHRCRVGSIDMASHHRKQVRDDDWTYTNAFLSLFRINLKSHFMKNDCSLNAYLDWAYRFSYIGETAYMKFNFQLGLQARTCGTFV